MKNESGFTLLEVLVALVILTVGIMAVMQLFPSAMRESRTAMARTEAAHLATSELGMLRAVNSAEGIQQWMRQSAERSTLAAVTTYALYSGWQTSVQRVSDSQDTYRVTFTVQMQDGQNETFVTYVTPR